MPDGVIIRDLEPADVDVVVDIALAAWEPIYASYRKMLGDEIYAAAHPNWKKDKEGQIRGAIADDRKRFRVPGQGGSGAFAVAELDGRVVGFVSFYAKGSGIGEIGNNAVHSDFQRRGIATRLYEHALARLKEQGMRYAEVGTGLDPAHAPARRAYEKAGFDRQRPTVTYYRTL